MKGSPKLIPCSNPIEGMKVVCRGRIGTIFHKNGSNVTLVNDGTDRYKEVYKVSELQQIIIEYEPYPHSGISKKGIGPEVHSKFKETLTLHPDNYEQVLPLIGREVDFSIIRSMSHANGMGIGDYAQVTLSSPIMYSEEEVLSMLTIYIRGYSTTSNEVAKKRAIDFYNVHKKK